MRSSHFGPDCSKLCRDIRELLRFLGAADNLLSTLQARSPELSVWSMKPSLPDTRAGRDVLARIERGLSPKASADWPLMRDTVSINNE